ncbi:MAG TPA: hypothetical protein ENI31_01440, partial [Candidatus Omnitrophica bacterium]|nr:hypothetical protein [Candidatus Omnitrophota bacterium]
MRDRFETQGLLYQLYYQLKGKDSEFLLDNINNFKLICEIIEMAYQKGYVFEISEDIIQLIKNSEDFRIIANIIKRLYNLEIDACRELRWGIVYLINRGYISNIKELLNLDEFFQKVDKEISLRFRKTLKPSEYAIRYTDYLVGYLPLLKVITFQDNSPLTESLLRMVVAIHRIVLARIEKEPKERRKDARESSINELCCHNKWYRFEEQGLLYRIYIELERWIKNENDFVLICSVVEESYQNGYIFEKIPEEIMQLIEDTKDLHILLDIIKRLYNLRIDAYKELKRAITCLIKEGDIYNTIGSQGLDKFLRKVKENSLSTSQVSRSTKIFTSSPIEIEKEYTKAPAIKLILPVVSGHLSYCLYNKGVNPIVKIYKKASRVFGEYRLIIKEEILRLLNGLRKRGINENYQSNKGILYYERNRSTSNPQNNLFTKIIASSALNKAGPEGLLRELEEKLSKLEIREYCIPDILKNLSERRQDQILKIVPLFIELTERLSDRKIDNFHRKHYIGDFLEELSKEENPVPILKKILNPSNRLLDLAEKIDYVDYIFYPILINLFKKHKRLIPKVTQLFIKLKEELSSLEIPEEISIGEIERHIAIRDGNIEELLINLSEKHQTQILKITKLFIELTEKLSKLKMKDEKVLRLLINLSKKHEDQILKITPLLIKVAEKLSKLEIRDNIRGEKILRLLINLSERHQDKILKITFIDLAEEISKLKIKDEKASKIFRILFGEENPVPILKKILDLSNRLLDLTQALDKKLKMDGYEIVDILLNLTKKQENLIPEIAQLFIELTEKLFKLKIKDDKTGKIFKIFSVLSKEENPVPILKKILNPSYKLLDLTQKLAKNKKLEMDGYDIGDILVNLSKKQEDLISKIAHLFIKLPEEFSKFKIFHKKAGKILKRLSQRQGNLIFEIAQEPLNLADKLSRKLPKEVDTYCILYPLFLIPSSGEFSFYDIASDLHGVAVFLFTSTIPLNISFGKRPLNIDSTQIPPESLPEFESLNGLLNKLGFTNPSILHQTSRRLLIEVRDPRDKKTYIYLKIATFQDEISRLQSESITYQRLRELREEGKLGNYQGSIPEPIVIEGKYVFKIKFYSDKEPLHQESGNKSPYKTKDGYYVCMGHTMNKEEKEEIFNYPDEKTYTPNKAIKHIKTLLFFLKELGIAYREIVSLFHNLWPSETYNLNESSLGDIPDIATQLQNPNIRGKKGTLMDLSPEHYLKVEEDGINITRLLNWFREVCFQMILVSGYCFRKRENAQKELLKVIEEGLIKELYYGITGKNPLQEKPYLKEAWKYCTEEIIEEMRRERGVFRDFGYSPCELIIGFLDYLAVKMFVDLLFKEASPSLPNRKFTVLLKGSQLLSKLLSILGRGVFVGGSERNTGARFKLRLEKGNSVLDNNEDSFSSSPLNPLWAIRTAGVAMPIFSLRTKGDFGIGDIKAAYLFIEWLAKMGQSIWLHLPIQQTDVLFNKHPSPFNPISAFAKEPLYICVEEIIDVKNSEEAQNLIKGYEERRALAELRLQKRVNYKEVRDIKYSIFRAGFKRFIEEEFDRGTERDLAFKEFLKKNRYWIEDYGLGIALMCHLKETDWKKWPEGLKTRQPQVLEC